ncbi:MAG: EAL domain-containing protein [Alcanivorax sp.]
MDTTNTSLKKFNAGDILMRQGESGENAFIIENGRVEITVESDGKTHVVGTRGEGAMLGEMSLIDSAPRTATVTAIEDCTVLEITKNDFTRRLEQTDSVLRMTIQVILTRYRDMLNRSNLKNPTDSSIAETQELSYFEQTDAVETIRIANEFMVALKNNEISLHYQPIIDFQTGEVHGFEALMRWIHPEKGFISPGIFIPVIENNGQIIEASKWAFKESCNALKRIQEKSNYKRELHMSVNFSSEDFSSPDFVDNMYNALSETDVKPHQLHLEITERILMAQPEKAKETLAMCRKAGMGISIDDFGTGYSSLNYLHAYPINTLKIDQSFVRDMQEKQNSRELVRSIITLGQNLNMSIIAEGVEQKEEAEILKEMGCHYAQGYYYAKPLPEDEVIEVLKNWTV